MEGLSAMLTDIGSFFTSAIGWMGDALAECTSHPALFIMVIATPVAGIGIGYLNRLLRA